MSGRILIGTRKGSFIAEKGSAGWKLRLAGHAGTSVNFLAADPESGGLWAALGFGHWGAKLSRSTDGGQSWADASQIKYPAGARYLAPPDPDEEQEGGPTRFSLRDATLLKLWVIAFGPGGRIYVGTIPGVLFVSEDAGDSFELNRPLWNHDSRGGDLFNGEGSGKTHWFGTPASEGEFAAGIHSIEVDPRDPERILVAISTAGFSIAPTVQARGRRSASPSRACILASPSRWTKATVARRGSCPVCPISSAWRSAAVSSSRARSTAASRGSSCARVCLKRAPTTSSTDMLWPRAAKRSPSAARPATSTSVETAERAGRRWRTICPPSTACASAERPVSREQQNAAGLPVGTGIASATRQCARQQWLEGS